MIRSDWLLLHSAGIEPGSEYFHNLKRAEVPIKRTVKLVGLVRHLYTLRRYIQASKLIAPSEMVLNKHSNRHYQSQMGYIRSTSAYGNYRKDKPHDPDPLAEFQDAFMQAAGLRSAEEEFEIVYETFLLVWQKNG